MNAFVSSAFVILAAVMTFTAARGEEFTSRAPFVMVLGIAQDAGFPQAGCQRECCREAWKHPEQRRFATSLAIVDPQSHQRWLVDCTPDFREQLHLLDAAETVPTQPHSQERKSSPAFDGIFLTHAHVGHYAGLIHLGREVIGADAMPVFAMPRMQTFLTENGPWSQLVSLKNIELKPLAAGVAVQLNKRITVTPILVPHRDEFSETVGFLIRGPRRTVLFIPDIDKWEKWDQRIEDLIHSADVAYLDGTFFGNGEIPGRDMSLIPHPFIEESLQRFAKLKRDVQNRIRFIHMNHTNPALHIDSAARRLIIDAGSHIAEQSEIQPL